VPNKREQRKKGEEKGNRVRSHAEFQIAKEKKERGEKEERSAVNHLFVFLKNRTFCPETKGRRRSFAELPPSSPPNKREKRGRSFEEEKEKKRKERGGRVLSL